MFAAKSTRGFYDPEFHRARLTTITDPAWIRPKVDIVVQPGESAWVDGELIENSGDEPITLRDVLDMSAIPDTLDVTNPDCLIPEDAVEITSKYHAELLAGQSEGKVIAWGANGFPFLEAKPLPTTDYMWTRIKAERDRRKDLGVLASGHWFHSDSASRIQQLALVIMGATMPAGIQWKTMGDTFVLMTPELAGKIFAATAALDQAIFSAAETHRVAMEASPVPADYDFSGGWPAIFEG